MEVECNSILCSNKFFLSDRKKYKFPSTKYYCIPCRKMPHTIRLKCEACLQEFCPKMLTQKYCSGECKVMLAVRRKYQCDHLVNKRSISCKICNVEIPPIAKTYRRKVCKSCRETFLVRYNKIKMQINGMQVSGKRKGVMNCLLCDKDVKHRLFCSFDCAKLGRNIRKSRS